MTPARCLAMDLTLSAMNRPPPMSSEKSASAKSSNIKGYIVSVAISPVIDCASDSHAGTNGSCNTYRFSDRRRRGCCGDSHCGKPRDS